MRQIQKASGIPSWNSGTYPVAQTVTPPPLEQIGVPGDALAAVTPCQHAGLGSSRQGTTFVVFAPNGQIATYEAVRTTIIGCPNSGTKPARISKDTEVTSTARTRFVFPIVVVLTILFAVSAKADPRYAYTASVLNLPNNAWGLYINDTGQILGMGIRSAGQYAFIYQNGVVQVLENLPGLPENYPIAINNAGQVIGFCQDPNFFYQVGYLRNADGSLVNFYTLTGSLFCAPSALNNSGTVVGTSQGHDAPFSVNPEGYVYQSGHLTYLRTFEGYTLNGAQCLNDAGQIVATYSIDDRRRAVLITGNEMRSLGTLEVGSGIQPIAMNNRAEVIGYAGGYKFGYPWPAFFYFDDHLHPVGNWLPIAINNAGQAVGQINFGLPSPAVMYAGGRLQRLHDLIDPSSGISVFNASSINDEGQILAMCLTKSEPDRVQTCLLAPNSK